MAKTKISEFDVNPDNNTDINSINIAEGCAPSGINNAIRQLMSDLKEQLTGASGDPFTVGGAFTANGVATFSAGSVSAPAITTTGDTNTGIFFPAADTIGFTEGGVEGLRLNANGQTSTSISGTASLPSFTRTGDENTGIFFPAADTIAFTEGGVESMRIDASGNVGIGTSTMLGRLNISNGSGTQTSAYFGATDANITGLAIKLVPSSNISMVSSEWNTSGVSLALGTGGTERMRVSASTGNIILGKTTDEGGRFQAGLLSSSGLIALFNGDSSGESDGIVHTYQGAGLANYRTQIGMSAYAGFMNMRNGSNTQTVKITAAGDSYITGGNLLVGTTSAFGVSGIQVISNAGGQVSMRHASSAAGKYWRIGPDSAGNNLVVFNQNGIGQYMSDGGTSWIGTSDERLKTDLLPIKNATNKVSTLRAVTGRFKTDEENVSRSFLIAQDIQKVLPEAVDVRDDEIGTLGVRYTDVIPLLVAAIKELNAEVQALKQQLGK